MSRAAYPEVYRIAHRDESDRVRRLLVVEVWLLIFKIWNVCVPEYLPEGLHHHECSTAAHRRARRIRWGSSRMRLVTGSVYLVEDNQKIIQGEAFELAV